ncbi:anti-sigma factor [Paenibacillus gansuensis]|uniref:Anti-sigma-W factor RsiW n=1 Tax=Paenibacillus gansuensis TaxID=306542 RepID=A0ABW5P6H6_9BACL
MDCRQAISLIHEYLDGDLDAPGTAELNRHLAECGDCSKHFQELERTTALMSLVTPEKAPDDLTARIMGALPAAPRKPQRRWTQWVRKHPAISAAAVFLVVMASSFASLWNQESELIVKGTDLSQVVIQGDTVIVPEGHTVAGNLTVENGQTQVYGDVEGDLTVIDGSMNLASTAHIAGHITQVNQALDWIWYKIGTTFNSITN